MDPCENFLKAIFDFVDGELDRKSRRELEHHLRECSRCTEQFNRIRRLRNHLRELPQMKVQDHFMIILRERIRREIVPRGGAAPTINLKQISWVPALGLIIFLILMSSSILDRPLPVFNQVHTVQGQKISSMQGIDGSNINYVIDDFPYEIESKYFEYDNNKPVTLIDSLLLKRDLKKMKAHIRAVSF